MTARAADMMPALVPLGRATEFLDEILEVLRPLVLFEGFSAAECRELCAYMECFGAPSNTAIIREGEAGDFLAIVLTGRVRVEKRPADGPARTVALAGPGAFLGEMSLIDGRPRFASCVSVDPSDLAVLPRARLNALMLDNPRLGQKLLLMLLRLMAARLRVATEQALAHGADSLV